VTYLRHAARHVHHTVANYVAHHLGELGWTTPGNVPFDSPVVKVWKTAAVTPAGLNQNVAAGVVAITLGNEFAAEMQELGGALASQEYPIFIDVFQDTDATALTLASDIKDILMGRLPGTRRSLAVINQQNGNPQADWWVELDDIERTRPDHTFSLAWQTVKVTATAYFTEVLY
jgi:hypothetical protein